MKKFLFTFLLAAAVASAFTFVLAQEDQGDQGEKKFIIHGEIRERADYINNFSDFNNDVSDSGLMFPYRARLAAEGHFSKDIVGYAEFQMFGVWGDTLPIRGVDGITPIIDGVSGNNGAVFGQHNIEQNNGSNFTGNSVDLYQAWIGLNNIGGTKFSLKIGRQELVKGSEMLLGDLDFYSGISHDGMVGCFNHDSFDLDVWWTRPFQNANIFGPNPYGPPDHQSINFYGGWVDFKKIPRKIGVAAYVMYYENGTQVIDPGRRAFYTIGARANKDAETGKNGLVWSAELAMQSGKFNIGPGLGDTGDISASAYELMLGYNLKGGRGDHLFQVKYDVGSGNKEGQSPDKAKAFDPLFQDYHMRYGLSDIFTLTDLTAMSLGWNMHAKDHFFGVDLWKYDLTEDVTQPGGKTSSLGSEVDGWWKYMYNPNTQILAGFAYFKPGDVIKFATVPNAPTDAGLRLVGNLRLRF